MDEMHGTTREGEAQAMLERLRPWVECESPTYDAAAVNRMMDLAAADLQALGARVKRIAGEGGFGDSIHGDIPHPKEGEEPGILVLGHLDTVHPLGTLEELPFRIEGDRAYGPGILDMKGGCRIAMEAVARLRGADVATPLPVSSCSPATRRWEARARAASSRRRRGAIATSSCPSPPTRAASSPAAMPSHASTSMRRDGRAMREWRSARAARPSGSWRTWCAVWRS